MDTSIQLVSEIYERRLYIKLIEQLNKDFQLVGIEEVFLINSSPKELVAQLQKSIYQLIHTNFSDYMNLLYRIDISENEIKKIDGSDIEKLTEQVSFLILKRECQKVWIRSKF